MRLLVSQGFGQRLYISCVGLFCSVLNMNGHRVQFAIVARSTEGSIVLSLSDRTDVTD